MSGFFSPKRFFSFVFMSCLFLGLQSFTFLKPAPQDVKGDVIVVIEDVYFNVEADKGPILIAGNPSASENWVKVFGIETISSFAITNKYGQYIHESEINAQSFKFMVRNLETGYYFMQFNIGGKVYTETLVVDR